MLAAEARSGTEAARLAWCAQAGGECGTAADDLRRLLGQGLLLLRLDDALLCLSFHTLRGMAYAVVLAAGSGDHGDSSWRVFVIELVVS